MRIAHRRRLVVKSLIGLVTLLLLGSVACTTSNTQSAKDTASAQAAYCTDLNMLKTDLLAVQNLGPSSTVGQVRTGVSKVQDDMNELSKSAKQLQNAKVDQLSASYQNLQKSAQGLSDNTSMVAALATITPQIAAINNAQSQELGANCK
jgi:ABC-type transport system involved in cytochrome c biogenesis ATPase subunit